MTRVASVIVTYGPDLSDFDAVLSQHARSQSDLYVVVDNASPNGDEIEALCRLRLPAESLTLLRQPNNTGLGAALNTGIDVARAAGCSHVAFFDQDSVLADNTLPHLRKTLQQLEDQGLKVGAVGACQFDLRTGVEYPQRRLQGISMTMIWPSREPEVAIEVSFLITSGSLVDLRTLDSVGAMRADFFIDCIDIEWCFRAAAQGFRFFCIKTATVQHALGDRRRTFLGREVSLHSAQRYYYMFRNILALSKLPAIPWRFRLVETAYFLCRAPIFFWLSGCSRNHLRHMLLGIADGLRGRMGPLQR